jgi:hypothetical protein
MAPRIRSRRLSAWFIPIRSHQPEKSPSLRRRWLWVALVLLAGYLLFCHGCHGDEDNELFIGARNVTPIRIIATP